MGKGKIKRFEELSSYDNVFEPHYSDTLNKDYFLKGKWNQDFFKNDKPIILELGCGKGEYTIGLAQKHPDINFIGIDIKGARMWKGAKQSQEMRMKNVSFLRTRIEFIKSLFSLNEVDEIWVTFPDPQLKKRRAKKRLTSSTFLNKYKEFLKSNGIVHLKTDNDLLYQYTLDILAKNNLTIIENTNNLYKNSKANDILSIKTFYENQYLEQGKNINYIKFQININKKIVEPDNILYI